MGVRLREDEPPPAVCPQVGIRYVGSVPRFASRKEPIVFQNDFYSRSKEFLPSFFKIGSYQPAVVNDANLFTAFNKYNICSPYIDAVALNKARIYLMGQLRSAGVYNTKVHETAGIIMTTNLTTGPGFPYKTYGMDRKQLLNTEAFARRLDEQWDDWVTGSGRLGMSSGLGKHELRDLERVRNGKTRQFSDVPFETLINGARLTSDFSDKLFEASKKGKLPIFGGEDNLIAWKNMYKEFSEYEAFWDTDFSAWDSRVWTPLLQTIYRIRYDLLRDTDQTESNRLAMISLCEEICHSYVVLDTGHVFQKSHGNLSGQPSTFVDNSLVNMLAFYYIVFKHFDEEAVQVIADTKLRICGDDFASAFKKYLIPFFETIASRYEKDLLFKPDTSEVKYALTSVNFVSANFLVDGGYVYPLRDPSKMLNGLFYADTDDTLPNRLMRLDATIAQHLVYDDVVSSLKKIRQQEIELFHQRYTSDPEYLAYSAPDFAELRERCKL